MSTCWRSSLPEENSEGYLWDRILFSIAQQQDDRSSRSRGAIAFLKAASHTPGTGLLPCVVLTDLKMPGMDGIQFVKWIREQKRLAALTVIMLSNSALDADRKRAKAAGVDSYFVKLPKVEIIAKIVADASAA